MPHFHLRDVRSRNAGLLPPSRRYRQEVHFYFGRICAAVQFLERAAMKEERFQTPLYEGNERNVREEFRWSRDRHPIEPHVKPRVRRLPTVLHADFCHTK